MKTVGDIGLKGFHWLIGMLFLHDEKEHVLVAKGHQHLPLLFISILHALIRYRISQEKFLMSLSQLTQIFNIDIINFDGAYLFVFEILAKLVLIHL